MKRRQATGRAYNPTTAPAIDGLLCCARRGGLVACMAASPVGECGTCVMMMTILPLLLRVRSVNTMTAVNGTDAPDTAHATDATHATDAAHAAHTAHAAEVEAVVLRVLHLWLLSPQDKSFPRAAATVRRRCPAARSDLEAGVDEPFDAPPA